MKAKIFFKPKVVMSIHGYLSTGKWQNLLSSVISEEGLIPLEFKYGFTVRFDGWKIDRLVDRFHSWYLKQITNPLYELRPGMPFHRPSIVAHSLGTWILVRALEKYPEMKFDKIFLHGSIIPRSFDWYSLIITDKVNRIILERSKKDKIVPFGFIITKKFYPSCKYGFNQGTTFIKSEDVSHFGHSDFQYSERFKLQFEKYLYETPIQLDVVHGEDLDMKFINNYFKETEKLDIAAFGVNYINNSPVTMIIAKEWAKVEKNIWSFLIHGYSKKVEGYINAMAVESDTFDKFIKGEINESQITAADIISFHSGGNLNLIILSITISNKMMEEYGGLIVSKPGELLIMALAKKLTDLKKSSQKISRIACLAWSAPGEHLCKAFGLKKTEHLYLGHSIYASTAEELKAVNRNDLHVLARYWIGQL